MLPAEVAVPEGGLLEGGGGSAEKLERQQMLETHHVKITSDLLDAHRAPNLEKIDELEQSLCARCLLTRQAGPSSTI